MDLTKQPPRSALEMGAGVLMVRRTTDKCLAFLDDALGEYSYNCPLDRELFAFLGTDAEEFAAVVRAARGGAGPNGEARDGGAGGAVGTGGAADGAVVDAAVEAFVREKIAGRSNEEIVAWNQDFLRYEPDLSRPSYHDAARALQQRAPDRPDLTLWVDVIDIEEGRPVPTREEVQARRAALGLTSL